MKLIFIFCLLFSTSKASLPSIIEDNDLNIQLFSRLISEIICTSEDSFVLKCENAIIRVHCKTPQITRLNYYRQIKRMSKGDDMVELSRDFFINSVFQVVKNNKIYEFFINGYTSRKRIEFNIMFEKLESEKSLSLPIGKSYFESKILCDSIIETVLSGNTVGKINSDLELDKLKQCDPDFKNLEFRIEYEIIKKQSVDTCCEDYYIEQNKGSSLNSYKLCSKKNNYPVVFFKLFINSPIYELCNKLFPFIDNLEIEFAQIYSTFFYKSFSFITELNNPLFTVFIHTPEWVAEVEWSKRMQQTFNGLNIFALIFVQPILNSETGNFVIDKQSYTRDNFLIIQKIRERLYNYFSPHFSFYTQHRLQTLKDTNEFKIGCLNVYPEKSFDTDKVYGQLCEFDALVNCSDDNSALNAILSKGGCTLPILEMYPSSQISEYTSRDPNRLFYCGNNWDDLRGSQKYKKFFGLLEAKDVLNAYGPSGTWNYLGTSYKGFIPVGDGNVFHEIAKCGVSLCLHSQSHIDHGIATARFFESVAACALVICDMHPFFLKHFKDACLFIDHTKSAEEMAEQVMNHWTWIQQNPDKAREMAKRAHQIFVEKFSLEHYMEQLIKFYEEHSPKKVMKN